jgi:hypothetical protein
MTNDGPSRSLPSLPVVDPLDHSEETDHVWRYADRDGVWYCQECRLFYAKDERFRS